MTDAPVHEALWTELAGEIVQHYATGRRIVAVDGADRSATSAAADRLADALRRAGATVDRRALDDLASYTSTVVAPFRAGAGDAVLVLDGPILGTPAADTLAWAMWLDTDGPGIGGPGNRTTADAIVDVTDPAHPRRRFSDWCVIPRR